MPDIKKIKSLSQLRSSGYKPKSIKDEMRDNLIKALKEKRNLFEEIKGFDETVIPQLQTAILSKHNVLFLGLRGQAKTRIARLMIGLLDEYIPSVAGCELNDDPLAPFSRQALDKIEEYGEETTIQWIHRDTRYAEKLATPDVTIADLIGDVDPIKAATLKLTYADERVIHYGMLPRSNRSIFVINELPDLQARIQVALFNILQEGDIQIRGFKLRLPLDIQFVFTANPEDYTNRGSIVTPLKDRIGSQILTHYPRTIQTASEITEQESKINTEQKSKIKIHPLLKTLIEQIAFEARQSEFIDQKSGVSARLTISAYENLYSTVERRMLLNNEKESNARIGDLKGIIPAITGKVELVYEGELEGITSVALALMGKSIRKEFLNYFPDPAQTKKKKTENPYEQILNWFTDGNEIDLVHDTPFAEYAASLAKIPGLKDAVKKFYKCADKNEELLMMEFMLHGLAEFSQLSKKILERGNSFKDMMSGVFNMKRDVGDEEE